jgi:hypothetical protein
VGWLKTWARRMWLRAARYVACLANLLLQTSCQSGVYAGCLWGKARSVAQHLGMRINVVQRDASSGAMHRRSALMHRGVRMLSVRAARRYARVQHPGSRCIVVHERWALPKLECLSWSA